MCRRRSLTSSFGSRRERPSTSISPESTASSRLMQRSSVLLPDPDGPITTTTCPRSTRMETSLSTRSGPNDLKIPRMSIIGPVSGDWPSMPAMLAAVARPGHCGEMIGRSGVVAAALHAGPAVGFPRHDHPDHRPNADARRARARRPRRRGGAPRPPRARRWVGHAPSSRMCWRRARPRTGSRRRSASSSASRSRDRTRTPMRSG